MKIGEFSKECGTSISLLRHYDKLGLLRPIYIDRFTEYRYYDRSQIEIFKQIRALKSAGFSLSEIKLMINSEEESRRLFENKREQLILQLKALEKLKEDFQGGRIMKTEHKYNDEQVELPFVNDEDAVGKWQILSVDDGNDSDKYSTLLLDSKKPRYIYFLPDGENYWCYGWTKGKLIFYNDDRKIYNDYKIEKCGDDTYMTIDFRSFDYAETGETALVKLKKTDNAHYTKEQIARKDDISKPFVNDRSVIGKWKVYCFIDGIDCKKDEFIPEIIPKKDWHYQDLFFKSIEFYESGSCSSVYADEIISGDDMQTWTKGHLLRKYNSCDCAYEIKLIDGKEYLIMEWKSGDYRYGGRDSSHYVFVRE